MAIDVNQFNADLDLLHDDINNKVHPFTHGDETTDVELGGKQTPSIRKLVKQVQDDQNTIKDEIIQIKDDIVDDAARLAEEAAADASAEAERQAGLAKNHADRAEAALGLAEGQLPVPASQAEVTTGTDEYKYLTPKTYATDQGTIKQDIADLKSDKADIASPTFTGTPKAPTPESGSNDDQIATVAYANTAGFYVPTDNLILTGVQDFNNFTEPGCWEFLAGLHLAGPPSFDGSGTVAGGVLRVTVSGNAPARKLVQEYIVWLPGAHMGVSFTRSSDAVVWSDWRFFMQENLDAKLAALNLLRRQTHVANSSTFVAPASGMFNFLVIAGGGAGGGNNGGIYGAGGGAGGYNNFEFYLEKGAGVYISIGAGGTSASSMISRGGGNTVLTLPNGRLIGTGGGGAGGYGYGGVAGSAGGGGGGAGGGYVNVAGNGGTNSGSNGGVGAGAFAGGGGGASSSVSTVGGYGGACYPSAGGHPSSQAVHGVGGAVYSEISAMYGANYGAGGSGGGSIGAWGNSGTQGFVAIYY